MQNFVKKISPVKDKAVTGFRKVTISNACAREYHDRDTQTIPIMTGPVNGLIVKQLFWLMIGEVPCDQSGLNLGGVGSKCSEEPTFLSKGKR